MNQIAFEQDAFSVDAALIAEALGMPPRMVLERIRAGQITTLCERGMDEDAGRFRLTFRHGTRRLQLLVDPQGNVITRSVATLTKKRTRKTSAHAGNQAADEVGHEHRP
jgi:hypothetical protein